MIFTPGSFPGGSGLGSGRRHTCQVKWSLFPWTYRKAIFHSHQITVPFRQGLCFLCFTWKGDIWIKQWDLSVQLPTVMGEVEADLHDIWSSPGLLDNVICPPTSTEPSAIAYKSYIWWNMWSGLLAWAGHHDPHAGSWSHLESQHSCQSPAFPTEALPHLCSFQQSFWLSTGFCMIILKSHVKEKYSEVVTLHPFLVPVWHQSGDIDNILFIPIRYPSLMMYYARVQMRKLLNPPSLTCVS